MNEKSWTEYFRVLTPAFMLTLNVLAGVMINGQGAIKGQIAELDRKVFMHLTNDEIHSPKSFVLSKPEFEIYQDFRSKEVGLLKDQLLEMRAAQQEHFKVSLQNSIELRGIVDALKTHVESTNRTK